MTNQDLAPGGQPYPVLASVIAACTTGAVIGAKMVYDELSHRRRMNRLNDSMKPLTLPKR